MINMRTLTPLSWLLVLMFTISLPGCVEKTALEEVVEFISKAVGIFGCRGCSLESSTEENTIESEATNEGMLDVYSRGEGEISAEDAITTQEEPFAENKAIDKGDNKTATEGDSRHKSELSAVGETPFDGELARKGEADHTGDLVLMLPGNVPLALMWIPAGTFMMGRYPGEQHSRVSEVPQHEVTLSQGFYMGKYEVTQAQWRAVMKTEPSFFASDNNPVEQVSWYDIQIFTTRLNSFISNTGQGTTTVRLPSEAEWEYACRAGTTTRFYWGNDPSYTQIGEYAWYDGNNNSNAPKPVGGKLPNSLGLYDMSGNVREWCQDWYGNYPSGSVIDPRGPNTGIARVLRCGSFHNDSRACRSTYREFRDPNYWDNNVGFRVVAAVSSH